MRKAEGLLALAILALTSPAAAADPIPPHGSSAAERDFIARHWSGAILPQGPAPERFSAIERSLQPEACGACHPVQFGDWQTSLHSKSMGHGITGQLVEMARREPAAARSCFRCHAPVAEQRATLYEAGRLVPNPDFDSALQSRGIICASCHVRGHEHFGPPRRDGSTANRGPRPQLPHGGVTRTSAFLRAEFCASCHQFGRDGLALNGTPLENTYEEWKKSPAARRGLQCQNCHMPDRRHLWRGIHDRDMVRSGLTITLRADKARYRTGDLLKATLVIATPGVGHAFPTYVTPQVRVRAELVDADNQPVAGSVEERVIGRQVPLDLSREIADTRIQPGGRFILPYARRLMGAGLRLRVTVTVLPDEFYTRFFDALLVAGAGEGGAEIREALEATRRSPYTLYANELPLT
jgi:hypothetical protein